MPNKQKRIRRKVNEIKSSSCFNEKLDIDYLLSRGFNLCVSRRVDGEKNSVIKKLGNDNIIEDSAVIGQPADFSVNLLGGRFGDDHIGLYSNDEINNGNWDGRLEPTLNAESITEKSPCFAIYYNIKDFLNFPVKQTKTFPKESEYKRFIQELSPEQLKEYGLEIYVKNKKYEFLVRKKVNHKPTNMNYWHVTFDLYSFESPNEEITSEDRNSSHRRILSHFSHDFLMKSFIIDNPLNYKIPCRLYIRGKHLTFYLNYIQSYL